MRSTLGWTATLNAVGTVLTLIVVLVGLILSLVAYFRKGRSRVALLGAVGFLLMILLSCCGIAWRVAQPAIYRQSPKTTQTLVVAQAISLFLLTLLQLIGIIVITVAIWIGGKKDEPPKREDV